MSFPADHHDVPHTPPAAAWDPADPQETIRAILNALPAMVGYWDRDLRNRMANSAYVEFFGKSPEEMYGLHISEVLGPELYAKNRVFMERALAGEAQTFDREITIPSGEVRYTQASYIPDVVGGEARGFFVLVTDITARHVAETRLHESEERYRTLVEHLPRAAITLVDRDLRLTWFGGGVPQQAGLDAAAFIGLPVEEASGGGDHGTMVAGLYRRALDGEEVGAELHSHVTGRDFRIEIAPLRSPDGEVQAALGVAQDITERKRSEAALRLQSQITENMAEGALLVRADDLVIVHANATTERMFGYAPGELIGVPVSVLNAPDALTPEQRALEIAAGVLEGSGSWSGEILSVRKDRSEFWRRTAVSRFEHPEHGTLLVSVIADVTERREREAEERAHSRIATLVAEGAGPDAVFSAVADEIRGLFRARGAAVTRFEGTAGLGVVLATASEGRRTSAGESVVAGGSNVAAAVQRSREAAQRDHTMAAPIVVAGALWGAVDVDFGDHLVPADAAVRLERFARLAAMAISNAEAWDTLSRQASTDAVTGIANHRAFHERLSAEVERARRYGRDLSLVLFDVDHFKKVNDLHGHQVGDRVLAEVARRLSAQAREGELVARVGGEEFAWLMPETTEHGAHAAADRVRSGIEAEPFDTVGTVTVSAGVCSSEHGRDPEALVRLADLALYQAKDSGRNTTCLYTDDVGEVPGGTTGP